MDGSLYIIEWKIENLSHWCPEVHGECIQSPGFYYPCSYIELYSNKGRLGERLGVRFCGVNTFPFSGELAFYSSEGSLLYEQPVNGGWNETVLELPPGPKFEDVLSKLTREDFITVRLHMEESLCYEKRMCTTLNVFKLSFKLDPGWIGKVESDATKEVCYIQLSPNDDFDRMWLKVCFKDNMVLFVITPPTESGCPFAVEASLTAVDSCAKDERVFRDNNTPWTFGSLHKKELVEKGVSIFLCLKTKHLTKGPFYLNCSHDCVSIEPNNTLCFSDEKAPSAGPDIPNKDSGLTKDSGSQTSAVPDDTVRELSKELMFLYQDQDFSDITLTCDSISFPVHKNILSARSPVFKTMLSTGIKTEASEVDIGDLDPSTLSRFLTHLYTGAVDEEELQGEIALKLYYAADKYEVPSLKRECVHCLSAEMSISNVCDILSLADRHRDAHLLSDAHDFLLKNFNDVLKSKEWESFMGREPLLAVKTVTHLAAKDPK